MKNKCHLSTRSLTDVDTFPVFTECRIRTLNVCETFASFLASQLISYRSSWTGTWKTSDCVLAHSRRMTWTCGTFITIIKINTLDFMLLQHVSYFNSSQLTHPRIDFPWIRILASKCMKQRDCELDKLPFHSRLTNRGQRSDSNLGRIDDRVNNRQNLCIPRHNIQYLCWMGHPAPHPHIRRRLDI